MSIDFNKTDTPLPLPPDDDFGLEEVLEAPPPVWAQPKQTAKAAKPTKPMLVDINELKLIEPAFLIEDAIETPCTGMIFGASGSGKSFFVLDLSLCCATGVPWLGKTVKEGPVIYLCGEGRHAVPRRVAAWKSVHGAIPNGRFLMSNRRVQFDPDTILEMLCEINSLAAMGDKMPVLIVIDTMARALPGDCDENSAKDTMAFIDMCDRLQQQYNCAVIIIHHTGHAEGSKNRARGSSALKGAMDLEILLTGSVIQWEKTKDSEPHLPIKYELVKTSYGDGPRDNSCVLKYDVKYDPTTENMTKPAKVGAQTLSTLCHKLGTTQIPEEVWRDEFGAEYGGGNRGSTRVAFNRAKSDLEKIKYIKIRGNTIYVQKVEIEDDSIEQAMFGHLLSKEKL